MQLVLDTKDLQLTKKRQSFLVSDGQESKQISPHKVTSIAITQNVLLSADAVQLAIKHQIPILFFDKIGKANARLWSPYFGSIATLRRQQVKFSESIEATQWIIEVFQLKTEHQVQNLKYLKNRKIAQKEIPDKAIVQIIHQAKQFETYKNELIADARNHLMGIEGSIAKTYFQALSPCLPVIYRFDKRSRRPAKDMFNATLNYYYGMLYTIVEGALFAAGLDPHLGILHTDEYKKPVLAFDLIEIFRPWADALLIEICLKEELLKSFFTSNQHGMFLNKSGKQVLIPRFNGWLRDKRSFNQEDASTRNHIYKVAGLLARRIRGKEAEEEGTFTDENEV